MNTLKNEPKTILTVPTRVRAVVKQKSQENSMRMYIYLDQTIRSDPPIKNVPRCAGGHEPRSLMYVPLSTHVLIRSQAWKHGRTITNYLISVFCDENASEVKV